MHCTLRDMEMYCAGGPVQAMDCVDAPLCDWELLQRRLAVPSWEQVLYR